MRTLDTAKRLSLAMNDAEIRLVDVLDKDTVAYLMSDEHESDAEECIAGVIKQKN